MGRFHIEALPFFRQVKPQETGVQTDVINSKAREEDKPKDPLKERLSNFVARELNKQILGSKHTGATFRPVPFRRPSY